MLVATGMLCRSSNHSTRGMARRLPSLIEAEGDIALAFDDTPDVEAVCFEGGARDDNGIAEKIAAAWVVDEIGLGGAEHALDLVCVLGDANAGQIGAHQARVLGGDAGRLGGGPGVGIDLLAAAGDEGERDVGLGQRHDVRPALRAYVLASWAMVRASGDASWGGTAAVSCHRCASISASSRSGSPTSAGADRTRDRSAAARRSYRAR